MYVKRDGGAITGISRWPKAGFTEELPADDAEIAAFKGQARNKPISAEELYAMLKAKGVVADVDRPRPPRR